MLILLNNPTTEHVPSFFDHAGIFAWITLNFITGYTHTHTHPPTSFALSQSLFGICVLGGLHHADSAVGMLDLGGGSFQITFSPQDEVGQ